MISMTLQLSSEVQISEPVLALSQYSTALLNQAVSYLVKVLTWYFPICMAEFFKTGISVSFLGLPRADYNWGISQTAFILKDIAEILLSCLLHILEDIPPPFRLVAWNFLSRSPPLSFYQSLPPSILLFYLSFFFPSILKSLLNPFYFPWLAFF